MAILKLAVLAERVVVDQFTNNVDLHCIIDTLSISEPPAHVREAAKKTKKPPAAPARISLFLLWARDNYDRPEAPSKLRVDIVGPKKQKIAIGTQVLNLDSTPFMRSIMALNMWPFLGYGAYSVVIYVDQKGSWKKAGSQCLNVLPLQPVVGIASRDD